MSDGDEPVKKINSSGYKGPERRSCRVWDRRIPHMPIGMGLFLRFMYRTPRRFWVLFVLACIGWIWMIAHISIILYVKFFNPS